MYWVILLHIIIPTSLINLSFSLFAIIPRIIYLPSAQPYLALLVLSSSSPPSLLHLLSLGQVLRYELILTHIDLPQVRALASQSCIFHW